MLTPPPVSSEAYPTMVGNEVRSNYVSTGLTFNSAYDDNILGGGSATPVSDITYSIWPTIRLNMTTERQQRTFTYSPGFTFYQRTSALNAADENATLNYQYRLSQQTTISLNDTFQDSSNSLGQPYPLSGGAISGSVQSATAEVIAPFADRLSNTANAGLSRQLSENSMVGLSGIVTRSNYPRPAEAFGLYNSRSIGGTAFYSRRLSYTQYLGFSFQYLQSHSNPSSNQANSMFAPTGVKTYTYVPFYTYYFSRTFSLSVSAGPQYVAAGQSLFPSFIGWKPFSEVSIGWQGKSTNLAASYSRIVTGGIGLPGAFDSNSVNASARTQLARNLFIGSGMSYSINKNITPLFKPYSPGGHSVSGTVTFQYSVTNHVQAQVGYAHLRQRYSGTEVISNAPDNNREFISLSYEFMRLLGR